MANFTLLKTRRVDPEPGESFDPATDQTPPPKKWPLGPGEERNSSFSNRFWQDYPFEREMMQRRAFQAQFPEGTQFMEARPPSFRDDLAQLIGQGAADAIVDWTPAMGFDWFDRMNYATESKDPRAIAETGAEGGLMAATAGIGNWALGKYGAKGLAKKGFDLAMQPETGIAFARMLDAMGRPREEDK